MSEGIKSPKHRHFESLEGDTREQIEKSKYHDEFDSGVNVKNSVSLNFKREKSMKMRESMRIPSARQKMFVKRNERDGSFRNSIRLDQSRLIHYSSVGSKLDKMKENANEIGIRVF